MGRRRLRSWLELRRRLRLSGRRGGLGDGGLGGILVRLIWWGGVRIGSLVAWLGLGRIEGEPTVSPDLVCLLPVAGRM